MHKNCSVIKHNGVGLAANRLRTVDFYILNPSYKFRCAVGIDFVSLNTVCVGRFVRPWGYMYFRATAECRRAAQRVREEMKRGF